MISNSVKSGVAFLLFCIPSRLLIAWLAKNPKYSLQIAYLLLIPAFGFLYIWWNGLRTHGVEVFGGKIWWNGLRPVHALLFILFSAIVISNNDESSFAWKILVLDAMIGLLAFVYNRIG
jgi:hypothetical protein